ncbi:mitochondrial FAD carrier protein flx1 [Malassezia psittaci]|uniref:Mitochondrial FAD carrier protein flx1 n=1 Tax=Malassezia psittaci TaxID=1821823 RepID=A0AAF0F7P1_9BASI|nr:mitochondrial FAD carrier protein flx1 [Malassezia psittaci]
MASTSSGGTPSYFASNAVDHAFAGMAAGTIATLCMNPLDLVKTRFQVNDTAFSVNPAERSWFYQRVHARRSAWFLLGGKPGVDVADALRGIVRKDGFVGLYRGVIPNIVGNASSWGLYFLFYTRIKEYMSGGTSRENGEPLSAAQHLAAATESGELWHTDHTGVITAILTNPIWVVKTRMFTTQAVSTQHPPSSAGTHSATSVPHLAGTPSVASGSQQAPVVYRGLIDGLVRTTREEGLRGLYKGVGLAVIGVSNGAVQFMAYEQLKQWRCKQQLNRTTHLQHYSRRDLDQVKLSNTEYTILSGAAKLFAITLTYPYQVVRARVQTQATANRYPNAWVCMQRTFREEGLRGFYRGFATNAIRILPGTCVTFVAYENVSWALRRAAASQEAEQR